MNEIKTLSDLQEFAYRLTLSSLIIPSNVSIAVQFEKETYQELFDDSNPLRHLKKCTFHTEAGIDFELSSIII